MGVIAGCDVSKGWIDVQVLEPARQVRIENEGAAISKFARGLPACSIVGMEATGRLHEVLANTLASFGHQVFVLNPRWVWHYARGLGARGKSDRGDAMVIARFVAAESSKLHAYVAPSPQQQELHRLLLRRAKLVQLKTATRQSFGDEAGEVLAGFNQLLRQIERGIRRLIAENREWHALAQRLRSIPGVGALTTALLVYVFSRTPFSGVDSFIAHTGMDPRPNDSGTKRGRRRLTHHGDAALRSALFMAAMAASKKPAWRALLDRYLARGLPSTAAFVILARKLAKIAFSLFRTGQTYDPSLMDACTGT